MNTTELRETLESESGTITWQELEKHFARGVLRVVSEDSKLIDIALFIAENNTDEITSALANNNILEPNSSQAKNWQQKNSSFLSVVVAPFVLIQEI